MGVGTSKPRDAKSLQRFSKPNDIPPSLLWVLDELVKWEEHAHTVLQLVGSAISRQPAPSLDKPALESAAYTAPIRAPDSKQLAESTSAPDRQRALSVEFLPSEQLQAKRESFLPMRGQQQQQQGEQQLPNDPEFREANSLAAKFLFIQALLDKLRNNQEYAYKVQRRIERLQAELKAMRKQKPDQVDPEKRAMAERTLDLLKGNLMQALQNFDRARFAAGWLKNDFRVSAELFYWRRQAQQVHSAQEAERFSEIMRDLQRQALENEREALTVGHLFLDQNLDGRLDPEEVPDMRVQLFHRLDHTRKYNFTTQDMRREFNETLDRLDRMRARAETLLERLGELKNQRGQSGGRSAEELNVMDELVRLQHAAEVDKNLMRSFYRYFHEVCVAHIFGKIPLQVNAIRMLQRLVDDLERSPQDPLIVLNTPPHRDRGPLSPLGFDKQSVLGAAFLTPLADSLASAAPFDIVTPRDFSPQGAPSAQAAASRSLSRALPQAPPPSPASGAQPPQIPQLQQPPLSPQFLPQQQERQQVEGKRRHSIPADQVAREQMQQQQALTPQQQQAARGVQMSLLSQPGYFERERERAMREEAQIPLSGAQAQPLPQQLQQLQRQTGWTAPESTERIQPSATAAESGIASPPERKRRRSVIEVHPEPLETAEETAPWQPQQKLAQRIQQIPIQQTQPVQEKQQQPMQQQQFSWLGSAQPLQKEQPRFEKVSRGWRGVSEETGATGWQQAQGSEQVQGGSSSRFGQTPESVKQFLYSSQPKQEWQESMTPDERRVLEQGMKMRDLHESDRFFSGQRAQQPQSQMPQSQQIPPQSQQQWSAQSGKGNDTQGEKRSGWGSRRSSIASTASSSAGGAQFQPGQQQQAESLGVLIRQHPAQLQHAPLKSMEEGNDATQMPVA